jgi:hypothetical protein
MSMEINGAGFGLRKDGMDAIGMEYTGWAKTRFSPYKPVYLPFAPMRPGWGQIEIRITTEKLTEHVHDTW